MKPIQCHRVEGLSTLINPGDFFFTYTKDDNWGDNPTTLERDPVRLWYKNPHGNIGSITINPNKENGAAWHWDRNLDAPTIKPSINEHNRWHGFITKGMMITCGR